MIWPLPSKVGSPQIHLDYKIPLLRHTKASDPANCVSSVLSKRERMASISIHISQNFDLDRASKLARFFREIFDEDEIAEAVEVKGF